jgi:2-polyprenyl-3-methyl-5-hydroxy-6-metoxy-1,4-benzoquinol methylase
MTQHADEIKTGKRFEFGANWTRFLKVLNDDRIEEASKSLNDKLEMKNFTGMSFLDIGSGSGLFSLSAKMLGAKVRSFDYDPQSVACTRELKRRYFPDDLSWTIEEGSVLNLEYMKSLGTFDIVYSWGVLHHTGSMWQALENVSITVANGGLLYLAIYNDQGGKSTRWTKVKKFYCSGIVGRFLVIAWGIPYFVLGGLVVDIVKRRHPMRRYTEYKNSRGMSVVHDWFDWLGGYPFEVAKPEEIFSFYRKRGYSLLNLKTVAGSHGCNEYVFRKGLASS